MLSLEWLDETQGITNVVDFDASVKESYELPVDVTDHAVEAGAAISDHARAGNETIALEAWVTNTPVVVPGFGLDGASGSTRAAALTVNGRELTTSVLQFSGPFDRRRTMDALLRALADAGQLLTVRTSLRDITNVVIARYKVERDKDTANALAVSLDLRRVTIVQTQTAAVRATRQRRGQRQQNRGGQPAAAPPPDRRTGLQRVIDGALRPAVNFLGGPLGMRF